MTRLKQKSLLACVKSYVASSTAASLPGLWLLQVSYVYSTTGQIPTYSSANIFFAVSASYTGFFSGLAPGAIAPNPIMFKVLLNVQPSGMSSWISTNCVLSFWQVSPTLLMIL